MATRPAPNHPAARPLAAACLIAIAAAGCSKRSFRISAGSMLPAFAPGMEVSADTRAKTPARGEVWVFRFPENPKQEFVKRVVGLPGDRIEMSRGALVVNGKPVPSCAVGAYTYVEEGQPHPGRLVLEKVDAAAYLTFLEDLPELGAQGPWTAAGGELFMVGDNRLNSHDSRTWRAGLGGGLPEDMLIGRVDPPPLGLPRGAEGLGEAFAKCKVSLGVTP